MCTGSASIPRRRRGERSAGGRCTAHQHRPGADDAAQAATADGAVAAADTVDGADELTDALADLYSYVYAVEPEAVRTAAELRARAMVFSDLWVREGCDLGSPLLVEELTCLVRSYGSLLTAVR